MQGSSDEPPIDFHKDLGFNSYSSFAARADWKFTRESHFYVSLSKFNTSPSYRYDIIRRKRGHLGIGGQVDLFNTSAKITGDTGEGGVVTAKASLLAPVPVAGPDYRIYLTNSPRVFLGGNVYGMYFFGYGNFVSMTDALGVTLSKHISVNAGYQLGSRWWVNNSECEPVRPSFNAAGCDRRSRVFFLEEVTGFSF